MAVLHDVLMPLMLLYTYIVGLWKHACVYYVCIHNFKILFCTNWPMMRLASLDAVLSLLWFAVGCVVFAELGCSYLLLL